MSYLPDNVTALSQQTPREKREFRHLGLVARVSLLLFALAAPGGPSCVITSSPDFAKPTQTPPFLTGLTPAPYLLITVRQLNNAYTSPTISFQVVSEDLQSAPLQGLLLLDFQGFSVPNPQVLYSLPPIAPGHFASLATPTREPPKPIDLQFPSGIAPGCHSVTLVVTHEFKYVVGPSGVTISSKAEGDIATATWSYDLVDPDPMQPPHHCGPRSAPTGDGGAEMEAGGP
jgi:hypothetical protein